MATLDDFRSFVRTHLDVDSTDLPNELLDEFIREGAKTVQYHRSRWTFFQDLWTLTTVPEQATYQLSDLVNGSSNVLAEIRSFVRDDDGVELAFAGEGRAEARAAMAALSADPALRDDLIRARLTTED